MLPSAVLIPAKEGGFVALDPETGTTTQGDSMSEALANLREAVELYLEEFAALCVGENAPIHKGLLDKKKEFFR